MQRRNLKGENHSLRESTGYPLLLLLYPMGAPTCFLEHDTRMAAAVLSRISSEKKRIHIAGFRV